MSNAHNAPLIDLVRSLEKSEKRHFKLYSKRNYSKEKELNYVHLFDVIDRFGHINHDALQKRIPSVSKRQLSDLKNQLYKHLLKSLRMLQYHEPRLELREMIDHAHILYKKGLFMHSLSILEKAKQKGWKHEEHVLVLECIEFEKQIEARHVTHSHDERASELTRELKLVRSIIRSEVAWSDLSLELYSKFLRSGYTRNKEEQLEVEILVRKYAPETSANRIEGFYETLNRLTSMVWFNYIKQDFVTSYRYSLQWVDLCEQNPNFSDLDPKIIIKGYHKCLSSLFYCLDERRHTLILKRMSEFLIGKKGLLDENAKEMAFGYYVMAELNAIVISGKFSSSKNKLIEIEKKLQDSAGSMDQHRLMIFWYKIGSIYFTMGDKKKCIAFLNRIINSNQKHLRSDVQCFARILSLVAHFEMGNDEFIPYQFRSVYRFLLKMEELQAVQRTILEFIRKSVHLSPNQLHQSFIKLRSDLIEIRKDPFENRAFLYLDIISWLSSHINNEPVEDVINRQRLLAV